MSRIKQLSRNEIKSEVEKIFEGSPKPEMLKKAKRLLMSQNIKIGELRKKFCKRCYSLYDSKNSEIRIKKPYKIVKCKKCGFVKKYKLKQ
jgi:RNase P subunit RPR2